MELTADDSRRMNRVLRHRLRNLASGLRSALMLLGQELDDRLNESEREYFPLLKNECNELQHITDRLNMLFDEMPPGDPARLSDILALAVERVRSEHPALVVAWLEAGDCLEVELGAGAWAGLALQELLRNAAQAAPAPTVTVVGTLGDTALTLRLRDRGPGIKPEDRGQVFDPFFTTRPRHLGVGLTAVRRWMKRQGGSVRLLAEEADAGLGVELCWPLPEPASAAAVMSAGAGEIITEGGCGADSGGG